MWVHTFPEVISLKMNVLMLPRFELANHVSHYAITSLPFYNQNMVKYKLRDNFFSFFFQWRLLNDNKGTKEYARTERLCVYKWTCYSIDSTNSSTHLTHYFSSLYFYIFIILNVRRRAIVRPHQSPTRGDATVSVCSPMAREIGVQYQRLKKWYLMPPYLTLSIVRYGSRVKWSNPGKGVVSSPTPRCSRYWKGSLPVTLDYSRQLYLLTTPGATRSFCHQTGYENKQSESSSW